MGFEFRSYSGDLALNQRNQEAILPGDRRRASPGREGSEHDRAFLHGVVLFLREVDCESGEISADRRGGGFRRRRGSGGGEVLEKRDSAVAGREI